MVKNRRERKVMNHQKLQRREERAIEAHHLLTVFTCRTYHNLNGLDPIVHSVVDHVVDHAVEAIHEILFKEQ
jgi:hypothetical protein